MNARRIGYIPLALALVLMLIVLSDVVHAKSVYIVGDEEHPWCDMAWTMHEADVSSQPGWLGRRRVEPEENLARTALSRGGTFWLSWEEDELFTLSGIEPMLADGFEATSYVSSGFFKGESGYPERRTLFLDLGGTFGVNRVHFYPGNAEGWWWQTVGNILGRSYRTSYPPQWTEIGVNDGSPKAVDVYGQPILTPVWGEQREVAATVDVTFPVHRARYVGVSTWARGPFFNLAELEVYGEGFVARSTYTSEIMDLGGLADVGNIRWDAEKHPNGEIRIYTRSGMDGDPNIYWRKAEGDSLSRLDASGHLLTKEGYQNLPYAERGGITYDTDHWSFWSGAYPFEEGLEGMGIVSPAPRRYVQIKVELCGGFDQETRLDWIQFEYSRPPLAQKVIGEVFPVEAIPSQRTTFHYAIEPRIRRGDRGFDHLEIRTPIRVDTVRAVRRDEVDVPFTVDYLDHPTRFVVHFPKIHRNAIGLEVDFDTAVLRYGTTFEGRVFDSSEDEVSQRIVPGDATPKWGGNTLSVRMTLEGALIASVTASPNPFTPNGDGIHDEVVIAYDVLQVVGGVPVSVEMYDLEGRLVRRVYAGRDGSGRYRHTWDGTDDVGRRVPPGMYLYRISVHADAASDTRVGMVSVVY